MIVGQVMVAGQWKHGLSGITNYCSDLTGNTLNQSYTGNTGFFFLYRYKELKINLEMYFSGESGLYTCDGIVPLSPDAEKPIAIDGQDWFSISSYGGRSSCC